MEKPPDGPMRMPIALKMTRRGGGPRSAAGKRAASRNALRHGFAAATFQRSPSPERLERLAYAIASDDCDPAIVAQAFRIAENELMLSEIAAHKVWVVERLRERYAVPFAAKDNSLQLGAARVLQAWLAEREIESRLPAILAKYEARLMEEALEEKRVRYRKTLERDLTPLFSGEELFTKAREWADNWISQRAESLKASGWMVDGDDIVPVRLKAMLEEADLSIQNGAAENDSNSDLNDCEEYEALEAAIRDLVRLDRYEQRAWSRQKRAILELANIKLARRFDRHCANVIAWPDSVTSVSVGCETGHPVRLRFPR